MNIDGVNIVGPAFGELGLGEDVRTLTEVLLSLGIPVSLFNYPKKLSTRQGERAYEQYVSDSLPYRCSIFCFPAFELMRFYLEFGPEPFVNRYNIGYWPWELSQWPEEFSFVQELVDEIWASSRFTLDGYRRVFDQPVFQIPLVVIEPSRFEPLPPLSLSNPDAFKFLYVFDANSTLERKNPEGLLRAFDHAFQGSPEVCLILKTMNYRHTNSELSQRLAAASNVVFINESYTKAQVHALFRLADAYVSLHRSEGFGRTLAEAMLMKRSVIASNYSGNTDFCTPETAFLVDGSLIDVAPYTYPLWRNCQWLAADEILAAEALKSCVKNAPLRQQKTELAYQFVSQNFSVPVIAEKVAHRLAAIPPVAC